MDHGAAQPKPQPAPERSRQKAAGALCPHCGSDQLARPFFDELPWVARCDGCGLVFAEPQPGEEELARIYDAHYYEQFGFLDRGHAANEGLVRIKKRTYGRMLGAAEPYLAGPAPGRRLLDVGCGLGYSLLAASARGWEATGLDPLADPARAHPGQDAPPVLPGNLETHHPERPYDLVSLIDVIEHLRDPVASIERAAELLRPGGVLLLATNNIESRAGRRMGSRWVHLHRAHLWFFTPKTLSVAAQRAGLKVRAVRTAWRIYNLDYVCSILARGSNFPLARRLSEWVLRWVPRPLRLLSWPPLPEGMLLIAQRPGT